MAAMVWGMMAEVLTSDDLAVVRERAGAVLTSGGLVVFPTETVYGVAALADDARAVDRLRSVTGSGDGVFTAHVGTVGEVEAFLEAGDVEGMRLMRRLMPGPVTVMVEGGGARAEVMGLVAGAVVGQVGGDGGVVSVRCPDDGVASAVLGSAGGRVVAAAAATGLDGRAAVDAATAAAGMGERVDLVVDGGRSRYGRGSTVVRLWPGDRYPRLEVVREGVLEARMVEKVQRYTVLLVCTGNTCRSPMAEGLAERVLAASRGVAERSLASVGVRVVSAGVTAMSGMMVSEEAVEVLSERGLDISKHRARPVTLDLLHEADVVYTMTAAHRSMVLAMAPHLSAKVHRLDEGADIADPIGRDLATYASTADQIEAALRARFGEG